MADGATWQQHRQWHAFCQCQLGGWVVLFRRSSRLMSGPGTYLYRRKPLDTAGTEEGRELVDRGRA